MIPKYEVTIIPQKQYKQLIKTIDNIYSDWIIDEDEIRKKYFMYAFNIMKKEIIDLFKRDSFWSIYCISEKYCMYKFKSGPKRGMMCNSRIDIDCNDKNGKWRCYHHVSKTIYSSKKRDSIDQDRKCIGYTTYGIHKRPCKNLKWNNSNYCKIHFKIPPKVTMNNAFYNHYLNKYLFLEIIKEHELYLKNIYLENEVNSLSNIDYDILNYSIPKYYKKKYIDNIDIRFNNRLCIEQDDKSNFICSNIAEENEDLCFFHNEEQQTVQSINDINYIDIVLEDIYESINDLESNKKGNKKFIDKCKDDQNYYLQKFKEDENNVNKKLLNNILKIHNTHKIKDIITNIIDNETYVNINYLRNVLTNYNDKIKHFRNEIEVDFPKYYKHLKGYIDILIYDINVNIMQKIDLAKINSIFINI